MLYLICKQNNEVFHVELIYENVKELQKNHTVKEMADIFGFSVTTMGRRLASLGLTKPTNRTDIKDEDVVKDWNEGLTIFEIAKKHNASHDTITKRLRKYGISCSRVEGIKKHFKRTHADKWLDIKEDLDKGMSVTSVREKHRIRYTKLLELMELNSYEYKNTKVEDVDSNLMSEQEYIDIILKELSSLNIEYVVEDDYIYLPKYNLGIEVNPVSTHSVDVGKLGLSSKTYHQEKSLLAEEKGVGLIQFYDADYHDVRRFEVFKEQLRALVSRKTKIGARKCVVKVIDSKTSNQFLNQYHFQGMERSSTFRYGLYYDETLVGVLTVGKSRYTQDEFEIVRYCMDPNVVVIGGFSKLFKHALKYIKSGSKIVSYMDLNKRLRASNVYETHGFQFDGLTKPDYVWVKLHGTETLSRYNTTKSKLAKEGYDTSKSEVEIMRERGYFRVFGSGSKRYVYLKN